MQLFDDGALDQSAYMDLKSLNAKKIEQAILSQRKIYVDKHVFLHRFYVGLNMQQSMSRLVSKTLDDFLPITKAILTRPSDRAQALFEAWKQSMQDLRDADEDAYNLKVPAFHWARVFRI